MQIRKAFIVVAAAGLVVLPSLVVTSTASAHDNSRSGRATVLFAKTNPVPGLNNGESASFVIRDDGRSLTIIGNGRGMGGAKSYVSLLYPDQQCSQTETPTPLTLNGAWQSHGDNSQYLFAQYKGAAYNAVKGKAGSVSVREITSATNAGGGNFTLVATARACAPINS